MPWHYYHYRKSLQLQWLQQTNPKYKAEGMVLI